MKEKRLNKVVAFRFKRFARKAYSVFNSMHKVVSIGVISAMTLTYANANCSYSEKTDTIRINSIADKELKEVTISDQLIEKPINEVAKLVTIISKEDIAQLKPQSVEDILSHIASLDVQTRGIFGVQSDISIRGGSFDQIAILLNGVNITSSQTGHYSFDIPINISDIEKIEVIHGPSALIYGSSAFCGGINIITKKNIQKKLSTKLDYGMHNLFNSEISSAYKIKNVENYLSLGYKYSDGYINNSDYKILNALFQSRISVEKNLIDIQVGYNKKNYGANTFYSAAYPNQYDNTSSILTSIKGMFGNKLKFIPLLYWMRHYDKFELIKNSGSANYHISDVMGGNFSIQYSSKLGVTMLSLELRNEGILSNVLGKDMPFPKEKYTKEDSRTNISYSLQHSVEYKKLTLSLGALSFYNNSIEYSFNIYPSLNINYNIAKNFDIYTSFSQAMRLPTFTDLYYTTPTHKGNAQLKEEFSQSVELGLRYKTTYFSSYCSLFIMDGKNMIDWVKKNVEDKWESRNITELNKKGIEIGGKLYINEILSFIPYRTTLQINYARITQRVKDNNYISNYVLNYLRDKLSMQLYIPLYKDYFGSTISFRYQKRMGEYLKYENNQPTKKVPFPAFSLFDINFNYSINRVEIYLNLNNIFNIKYIDLANIPQPGFWAIAGINVNIY
ncbi:MAG: TonB-dependent receptor [Bacteroidales bacterium]|jgi:iron complex outermembrane receptor protein|nr:TonB-dependent receptor [Bacteroidales bacterium]